MFSSIFHTIVYDPLYNALVFLISTVPYGDVGLAVIAITLLVRLVLYPIFTSSIKTQTKLKSVEPKMKELKEKYKDDKQTQAQKTMELYKEHQINPFAGILAAFIQIPIFITLYFIFLRGGFPSIDTGLLYSFMSEPSKVNMHFLGIIDLAGKSIFLALTAGISQFIQMKMSPMGQNKKKSENPSMKEDLARSMQLQMKYGLPVMITFIAYFISGAVALYWTTNNVLGILQEIHVRKNLKPKLEDGDKEEELSSENK